MNNKPAPAAAAPAPAAETCSDNCQTSQGAATMYMQAEILWSTMYMNAWSDPALMADLVKVAANANDYLVAYAREKLGFEVQVPAGVTLTIVFDSPTTVHLVLPAFQNIPPSPIDMVPHAL